MSPRFHLKLSPSSPTPILLLMLCFFARAGPINPGMVIFLPKTSVQPIFNMLLSQINPKIDHLEIDKRFELGVITLKGVDIKMPPILEEQFVFSFKDRIDALKTFVSNFHFKMRSAVDINIWGFITKGWILVEGKVANITFTTTSLPWTEKYHNKPFVSLHFETLILRSNDMTIQAEVEWVPDFVMKAILSLIKSTVIESVRVAVLDYLNNDFTPSINDFILEQYTDAMRIGDTDSSIQITLTDTFYFDKLGMYFPMEGTVFQTNKGYHRTEETLPMAMGNPSGQIFDAYLSEYTIKAFLGVYAGVTQEFKITNFEASIVSLDSKVDFVVEERGAHFQRTHVRASAASSRTGLMLDFLFTGYLKPRISKNKEGMQLNLDVSEEKLEDFKLETNSTIIASFADQLPSLLHLYFQAEPTLIIPFPNMEIFGDKVKDWILEARQNHLRIGFTI